MWSQQAEDNEVFRLQSIRILGPTRQEPVVLDIETTLTRSLMKKAREL
jgi:hypothetical protein